MSFEAIIDTISSSLGTIIALYALFSTLRDQRRRDRKDREAFVADAYQNFQNLHLALLQDTTAVKQLAKDRGKTQQQVKQDSIASLWINQAHHLFQLYSGGHLNAEVWDRFTIDMQSLFEQTSIRKRWEVAKQFYPVEFQSFIDSLTKV